MDIRFLHYVRARINKLYIGVETWSSSLLCDSGTEGACAPASGLGLDALYHRWLAAARRENNRFFYMRMSGYCITESTVVSKDGSGTSPDWILVSDIM